MIDYSLREVIENGNSLTKTQTVKGVETLMPITSAEDKAQRRLEVKPGSTLMMGIPNEYQLKFNSIKDSKSLLEAIEKRFGGNDATMKTHRNLLKWQYEDFTASSFESVDQTFDRLQKLNMHVVVWRNKPNLDSMSIDDLYNNLKDLEQIHPDDLEEIDLKWQMAILTMRARRFMKNTVRKLNLNGNETVTFDKTKVECYNCHKRGHFARECRAPRAKDNMNRESTRRNVPVEATNSLALVSCNGLGGYDWSNQAKEGPNYALMEYSTSSSNSESLNKLIDSQTVDNCKKGLGYNAVPPPHTCLFMHPKPDLSYIGLEEFTNEPAFETLNAKTSKDVPKIIKKLREDMLPLEVTPKEGKSLAKEKEPGKDYILLPLWTADPPFPQEPKSSQDARFKPSNDVGKKVNEVSRQENKCKDQEEKDSVNNTNRVNAVRSTVNAASNEINVVGRKSSIELPDDLNMPELEDISI
nr:hypothetical protein [Tanacetum cinerariifolium]